LAIGRALWSHAPPAYRVQILPTQAVVDTNASELARRQNCIISAGNIHTSVRQQSGTTMTTFDKREEGFEKMFAHDEELKFKANARRNKMLGLWAAEKLGMSGAEADAYAKAVVMADFEESGHGDVFKKVRTDFDAKGVAQSDQQIRQTMEELMAKAVAAIKASG
jgi:hypothetical protein